MKSIDFSAQRHQAKEEFHHKESTILRPLTTLSLLTRLKYNSMSEASRRGGPAVGGEQSIPARVGAVSGSGDGLFPSLPSA
mmetsp:Transcript_7444/g.11167  ORF Transcript_7444/g.11167 Transcript_7444/m.11167 type:complete len:81 (+) Transcript_7444:634-876(+)